LEEKAETFNSLFIKTMFSDVILASTTSFIIKDNEEYFLVTNKHNVTEEIKMENF